MICHEAIAEYRPERRLTWCDCSHVGCSQRSKPTGRWHRSSRRQGWWKRWSSCSDWCTELLVSRPPGVSWTETQINMSIRPRCTYKPSGQGTNKIEEAFFQLHSTTVLSFTFNISMETALHSWPALEQVDFKLPNGRVVKASRHPRKTIQTKILLSHWTDKE